MKANTKRPHNLIRKILIVFAILIVALAAAFFVYVGNYSHADTEAQTAMNGCEGVTIETDSDGKIIFAPSGSDTPNLHTGLIFYPGGKVEYTAYAPMMEKLARRGVTCIVLKMPFNLAILDVDAADGVIDDYNNGNLAAQETLSTAAAVNGDSDGSIAEAVDELQPIEHWYIGGHSLGGVAAAMYLAHGHAEEYDGLVLLGSYTNTDLSDLNIPVLSVIGENDGLVTEEKYEASESKLPADAEKYVIPGGCHAYFGSYGKQKGDGEPTITADQQREIAADVVVEWMQR